MLVACAAMNYGLVGAGLWKKTSRIALGTSRRSRERVRKEEEVSRTRLRGDERGGEEVSCNEPVSC